MNTETLPAGAVFVEPKTPRPLYVARSKVERIFLGLAPQTLANMASRAEGPPFFRRGKQCFYSVADIEAWLTLGPVKTNEEGKNKL